MASVRVDAAIIDELIEANGELIEAVDELIDANDNAVKANTKVTAAKIKVIKAETKVIKAETKAIEAKFKAFESESVTDVADEEEIEALRSFFADENEESEIGDVFIDEDLTLDELFDGCECLDKIRNSNDDDDEDLTLDELFDKWDELFDEIRNSDDEDLTCDEFSDEMLNSHRKRDNEIPEDATESEMCVDLEALIRLLDAIDEEYEAPTIRPEKVGHVMNGNEHVCSDCGGNFVGYTQDDVASYFSVYRPMINSMDYSVFMKVMGPEQAMASAVSRIAFDRSMNIDEVADFTDLGLYLECLMDVESIEQVTAAWLINHGSNMRSILDDIYRLDGMPEGVAYIVDKVVRANMCELGAKMYPEYYNAFQKLHSELCREVPEVLGNAVFCRRNAC